MVVFTIPAILTLIGGGIGGIITWFNSLPNTFKYILFLGGLSADAFVFEGFLHVGGGILGGMIGSIIQNIFGLPTGFTVSSFQLLLVFTFLPIVFFMLKNSLSHQ